MGGTGDSPVPSGDAPDGTGRSAVRSGMSALHANVHPVPLGESPSGAGGSPPPPTLNRFTRGERGFRIRRQS